MDSVWFVGPIDAATNLGFSGVSRVILSASSLAILAASRLISFTRCPV